MGAREARPAAPGACLTLLLFLVPLSCTNRPAFDERIFSGETQGTTYNIRIAAETISEQQVNDATRIIAATLDLIDRLMSTYRPDSEISGFNDHAATAPFAVAPEMIEVFEAARRVSEASGGAFDVTVAPLVRAWGFGPDGLPQPPPPDELVRLRTRVGYQGIEIDSAAGTLRKTRPDIRVDLNGIAQGYTVDKLAARLDDAGFDNYMVEIGGEVKARGHNARGIPWRIGIERPVPGAREVQRVIPLSLTSISSSGDYRKYREVDGRRISHTIDPRTGRPIAHMLASVSIVNPSCTLADGFCTAIMVLGPDDGYQLAVRENLAAMLLTHAGEGRFTEKRTPQFDAFLKAAMPR